MKWKQYKVAVFVSGSYLHQPVKVGVQIAGERFVNLYHRHKVLIGEQQFVLVVQHAGQVDSPTKNKTKHRKKKFINGRKTVSKMAPYSYLLRFFWNLDAAEKSCLMVVFFLMARLAGAVASSAISEASSGRASRTALNRSSRLRCLPAKRFSRVSTSRQPTRGKAGKKIWAINFYFHPGTTLAIRVSSYFFLLLLEGTLSVEFFLVGQV